MEKVWLAGKRVWRRATESIRRGWHKFARIDAFLRFADGIPELHVTWDNQKRIFVNAEHQFDSTLLDVGYCWD
ncbi:hypothetical protein OUZ56_009247 [Daphnia magna]|uniref:Uncharacterized protein n=1 Tax=Daphnia magna TaxID=35525 RepID=A0ABR0AFF6_9CRUS|nr:hypothetical protein OUZ56_009247 [Daphnia magna]